MTREELTILLEAKGCTVLLAESPIEHITYGDQIVSVLMRSYRTHNVDEVVKFLGKSASVVFLLAVETRVDGIVIRGNYITK
ncbi:hypothetical protein PS2_224 [Serratia phage PS2]|uniref:Uncharacterized protein n=1 Tax=Serratia phage PS2 TaxID=1481112 RepID=A0A023W5W9_9CAUD|nr:hypothetical protein FF83_gp191 [Serratia phage PS2]AHY25463.1 hypothetical protein PS2_224 [Serratia phage PS2]